MPENSQNNTADLAREANLQVFDLLRIALVRSRLPAGDEAAHQADRRFIEAVDFLSPQIGRPQIAFGVAYMAAQIIDQMAVSAGWKAEEVIDHFEETYIATGE